MPYAYVEPELHLEHEGVQVYPLYHSGSDEPIKYWFTTDPTNADDFRGHGQGGHFDVRRLSGRWDTTPTVAQWEEFWKPRFRTEHDAIDALIEAGIEGGRVQPVASQ